MNSQTNLSEYRRLRRLGWEIKQAKHAADVAAAFERAEAAGLVRFRVEPDGDVDLDNLGCADATEEERAELVARIERDGVWGIVSEYLVPACDACGHPERWEDGASVWGFVGTDYEDSLYDTDVKNAALEKIGRAV